MAVLRAKITDLPKVVAETERRALFQIEALLPGLGLIHDLELDMLTQIVGAHFLGEAGEYSFARAVDECIPVLLGARIEMPNGDQYISKFPVPLAQRPVDAGRCVDIEGWHLRQCVIVEDLVE